MNCCPRCQPRKDYSDYSQYPFHEPFKGMPPDPKNHETFFNSEKHHIHQPFADNTYGITEEDFVCIKDLCIGCVERTLTYLITTMAQTYYYRLKKSKKEHTADVKQLNAYLNRYTELTNKDHIFEIYNEGGG